MLNKRDLIKAFVNGATTGKGSNLYITGNQLINYNTIIAVRKNGIIYMNNTKYSQTTSRNQSVIRQEATELVELPYKEIYALTW